MYAQNVHENINEITKSWKILILLFLKNHSIWKFPEVIFKKYMKSIYHIEISSKKTYNFSKTLKDVFFSYCETKIVLRPLWFLRSPDPTTGQRRLWAVLCLLHRLFNEKRKKTDSI